MVSKLEKTFKCMQIQTLANKIAEINYRRKISAQHTTGKINFAHEPDQQEIQYFLKKRLKQYKGDFQNLKKSNLIKSPFLEIGAEYTIASSYLKSKFKTDGVACDISLHSLKKAGHFARIFKLKKIPLLVCADANNLPFKSNSFPFIFVYESLHHFPHPQPVLKEIKRVLAPGGILLIGAEPIKQSFQIPLWRRPTKLRAWEKALKAILVLPFISHIGKTEVDSGILEEAFTLKTWLQSLSIFDSFEAKVDIPIINFSQKISKPTNPAFPLSLLLKLTGGGIRAICKKTNEPQPKSSSNGLESIFICPNCKLNLKKEVLIHNYNCPKCKSVYQKMAGVIILLPKKIADHMLLS